MFENEISSHTAEQDILQTTRWNMVLTKSIWFLFLILFLFDGIVAICYCLGITLGARFSNAEYVFSFFVKPCMVVLATLLLAEGIKKFIAKHHETREQSWIILFTFVVLVTEVIIFHHGINVIYVIYILPITASLLYRQQKMLLFTYIFSIFSYFVTVAFITKTFPSSDYRHNYMDALGTIGILTATYTICRMVLSRTQELINTAVSETLLRMKLSHEILLDSLTQLYNHATFYQQLDTLIVSSRQDKTKSFSLILMDIDNFKSVNDTYGHDMGDEVILRLVETIKSQIQVNDLAFRYGGEEFAVLTTNVKHAYDLAEAIRINFEEQVYSGITCKITVSIGINTYNDVYGGKREFFSSVDKALYKAKQSGKNCVCVAD